MTAVLLARRPAVSAAHRQFVKLCDVEDFLNAAAIRQLVIEMDFCIAPGDPKLMGVDAIEMAADRAHQLGQILRAARVRGKLSAPFALALGIEPGNIIGVIAQRAILAKQFSLPPRVGLALPNRFSKDSL